MQKVYLETILRSRDELVIMNLPHLFNACGGMHLNKMKLLTKGTEGTQYLVDAFGYDTKQALHAYRILNFIERFEQTDFKDFKWSMTYLHNDREFMLDIKNGEFSLEWYKNFVTFYHDSKFKTLKEKYYSYLPDEVVKDKLNYTIKQLVKSFI